MSVLTYNQISVNTKNSRKWKPFDTLRNLRVYRVPQTRRFENPCAVSLRTFISRRLHFAVKFQAGLSWLQARLWSVFADQFPKGTALEYPYVESSSWGKLFSKDDMWPHPPDLQILSIHTDVNPGQFCFFLLPQLLNIRCWRPKASCTRLLRAELSWQSSRFPVEELLNQPRRSTCVCWLTGARVLSWSKLDNILPKTTIPKGYY